MWTVLEWIALGTLVALVPLRRVQWNVVTGVIVGAVGAVLGGWFFTKQVAGDALYFSLGSMGAGVAGVSPFMEARRIVNELARAGVLISTTGRHGSVLQICPPMPFALEHADVLADALNRVVQRSDNP